MVDEADFEVAAEGGSSEPKPLATTPDMPEVDPARRALVTQWCERVKKARKHPKIEKAFKRMRTCMQLAANGTKDAKDAEGDGDGSNYVVPIINRHINQAVATLYAKNPQAVAKRKQKMMFQLWDGDAMTLQSAMAAAQPQPMVDPMTGQPAADPMTGQPAVAPGDPNAMALVQEVMEAKAQMLQYDRMAQTLQLLFAYFLSEQSTGYKEQFKAMVRRAKVCGVAYVKLGYQRTLQKNPDIEAQIADVTSQVVALEAGLSQMAEGDIEQDSAKAEELKLLLEDLQSKVEIVVREGPVLSFPRATEIIIDPKCRHLKTFAGARWVAHEFDMDPDDVREAYGVNITGQYTAYNEHGVTDAAQVDSCARVWEIQDKKLGQVLVVCDGYPDFLVAPAEPDVRLERFWNLFPLVLNEIESEDELFPPSDVWNSRHLQREYNSTRQGLREHRIAARPKYAAARGKLEKADLKNLGSVQPHEILELNSLQIGERVGDLIQRIETQGIDPNLYEVQSVVADLQLTVGAQSANLGPTTGDTATESSIAEHSRETVNSSDVDDLDCMLSALTQAMGQLMFMELDKQTVIEICGPGAVWPDMPPTREQVAKDLVLEVEAGSSGKPNTAAELAKMERAMPFVTQLPGINPMVPAKKYAALLDWDVEEAIVEGMPSIVSLNHIAGNNNAAGGDPSKDPGQQGDEGSQNTEDPQKNEPQSQPEYPSPDVGMNFA